MPSPLWGSQFSEKDRKGNRVMCLNVKGKEQDIPFCVFPNKGGKKLFEDGAAEE